MKQATLIFSIAVAACVVTAGCSTGDTAKPTVTQAPAPAPSVEPKREETYDQVKVEQVSYEEQDGHIKVTYPKLSGLKNGEVLAQVNADLERLGKPNPSVREEVQKDQGTVLDQPHFHSTYTGGYELKFRQGSIMSFVFSSDFYTGGVHGMPSKVSYLVDLSTGKTYNSLQDLFAPGSGSLYRLTQLVKEQDTDKKLDSFGPFDGVELHDGFYVDSEGLHLYFAPYEHTPYALGFPEYTLAPKDFIDLIDPSTPFAKLWGDVKPVRQKADQDTLIRDLVGHYEKAIVTAVSTKDFEFVSPYLKPGSPLYQDQQDLVKKLGDQGIYEDLVSYAIDHIDGNKVYVTDTVKISNFISQGSEPRTETFYWVYTVDPATLTLTELAKWK